MMLKGKNSIRFDAKRINGSFIALLPLFIGVLVVAILYKSYDENSTAHSLLNVHNWSVMQYSPVGEYALLHMMLISNMIIILLGVAVYIRDVISGLTGVTRGGPGVEWLLGAGGAAVIGGGFCIGWFFVYCFTNLMSSLGVDAEAFVKNLVNWNDAFVILVFFCFLIGDVCLLKSYSLGLVQCETNEGGHMAKECEARKRFAQNAILFVDAPVLIGSGLLLFLSNVGLNDPRFLNLGPRAVLYFSHAGALTDSSLRLAAALPAIFVGGFSLGSIICQLIYSQIVFAVLIIRQDSSTTTQVGSSSISFSNVRDASQPA